MASESIVIYTDGAALGNPGPGGYGAVLMFGPHRKEISAGFRLTTNNRMELLAVIEALRNIKVAGFTVEIFTDSKYVCDAIEKRWIFGWKAKGWKNVKNVDLWLQFLPLYEQFKPKFNWVKGHAGIAENERCDYLATSAAQASPTDTDLEYEALKNGGQLL